ncbi:MAG: hypothetical protein IKF49_05135 [Clostridia bacterium]|nr:hypothetical protein [Clostridia bacterium]
MKLSKEERETIISFDESNGPVCEHKKAVKMVDANSPDQTSENVSTASDQIINKWHKFCQ